jgi:K+-transporting ATPase KdpF subunit
MNAWIVTAAILAGGLLIYLIAVLLRPEDFS